MTSAIRAIVTGHSRGIGRALADTLRQQGIAVLGLARTTGDAAAARAGIDAAHRDGPDRAAPLTEHAVDLANADAVQAWLRSPALAQFVRGAHGALLINNAGTVTPVAACGRQSAAAIADAVALNVITPLMLTDAFVAATAAVADRRVLHISSGAAHTPYAGWSVYCATKAALEMNARAAREDAVPGLRIAALAPGVVDTAMQATLRAADPRDFPQRPRFDALKADGALAAPHDVARRIAAWLLSPAFAQQASVDLRTLAGTGPGE